MAHMLTRFNRSSLFSRSSRRRRNSVVQSTMTYLLSAPVGTVLVHNTFLFRSIFVIFTFAVTRKKSATMRVHLPNLAAVAAFLLVFCNHDVSALNRKEQDENYMIGTGIYDM